MVEPVGRPSERTRHREPRTEARGTRAGSKAAWLPGRRATVKSGHASSDSRAGDERWEDDTGRLRPCNPPFRFPRWVGPRSLTFGSEDPPVGQVVLPCVFQPPGNRLAPRMFPTIHRLGLAVFSGALALSVSAQELVRGRPSAVLQNDSARVVVDLRGGAIGGFQFKGSTINPLEWNVPKDGDTGIHGFGHFLCLDRWGPPSDAEGAKGMPYHGEAASVEWALLEKPGGASAAPVAVMAARLPKAGFTIRRTVRLSAKSAVVAVREEVTNGNDLGRMYNAVQHPTIGGPFLDATTVVDCNGRRGFAQGGSLPNPEEPSFHWPQALNQDGAVVNLRHLTTDPNPNVVSFQIEETLGWITAATPAKGLLIGYLWKTAEYPWVSVWRDVRNGRPSARGLEFGTTGLHQPFPILARKPRIWDSPTFQYLDAGETAARSYAAFLLPVPADFEGVASIRIEGGEIVVRERRANNPRRFTLPTEAGLLEL